MRIPLIMVAQRKHDKGIAFHGIDQAMLLRDAARPAFGQVVLQRLGLADAFVRRFYGIRQQRPNAGKHARVMGIAPGLQILQRLRCELNVHLGDVLQRNFCQLARRGVFQRRTQVARVCRRCQQIGGFPQRFVFGEGYHGDGARARTDDDGAAIVHAGFNRRGEVLARLCVGNVGGNHNFNVQGFCTVVQ